MIQEQDQQALLQARAARLAVAETRRGDEADSTLVVEFLLGGEPFAIDAAHVREVFPLSQLTHVPCTPPHILGITNHRGELMAVVDIRRFFGMPFAGLTNFNKVLVACDEHRCVGLLVDAVRGMRHLPQAALQDTLPTFTDMRGDFIAGITGESLMLLNAARLLSDARLLVDEEPRR